MGALPLCFVPRPLGCMVLGLVTVDLVGAQSDTQLVSTNPLGFAAAGDSDQISLSADGAIVAFSSTAADLITGDTNGLRDVFIRDLSSGSTTRASTTSAGVQANAAAIFPKLAGNGRWVVFQSFASNLVAADANGLEDIFLHDRVQGTTQCVSVTPLGVPGSGGPTGPLFPYEPATAISHEGRFVAFASSFTNLVAGDSNGFADIFLRDRILGTTRRVSVSSTGAQANAGSRWPSLSSDGRFIAFQSFASNLVPGDTNGKGDVFVHDTLRGTTELVSRTSTGDLPNQSCERPCISADGLRVAFHSFADNLVPLDSNGHYDIFLRDRSTRTTTRVSKGTTGMQANGNSHAPVLSANGRYLAFWSFASNLIEGDTNARADIFRVDLQTGRAFRASLSSTNSEVGAHSVAPSISADGRFVGFESYGWFSAADTSSFLDCWVRDMASFAPATACWGSTDSAGCQAQLQFQGLALLSQPEPLWISASPVRNACLGMLLYSSRSAQTPFRGETLCLAQPLRRLALQSSGGDPATVSNCSGWFRTDFKQWVQSGSDPQLVPGAVVHCQYWYRETVPGRGPMERFSDAGYFELVP